MKSAINRCSIAALICAVATALSHGPAQAAYPQGTYSVTLNGLPAGLTVFWVSKLLSCTETMDFLPSGQVRLQEGVTGTFERVETASGPQFQFVQRPTYTGTVQPALGGGVGPCLGQGQVGFMYDHDLELTAEVQGPANPVTKSTRTVHSLPRIMTGASLHFTLNAAANSAYNSSTLPLNQTGPITLTRNVFSQVVVDNRNTAGRFETRNPVLQFQRTSGLLSNRLIASLFKGSNGRLCITAGTTVCQGDVPAGPNGGFVHGGIELIAIDHRTTGADLSAESSQAKFQFRLTPAFAAGTFSLVAFANDFDPFSYLVNGVLKPLDLLPWKAAVHPVAVQ
jgi:hypothetical protein